MVLASPSKSQKTICNHVIELSPLYVVCAPPSFTQVTYPSLLALSNHQSFLALRYLASRLPTLSIQIPRMSPFRLA
jgi:hypothetical protein